MRIEVASIFVDDQQAALDFYTNIIGFEVKTDAPMGEHRWLTVTSAEGAVGVELLLEPNANPIAQQFQTALKTAGIPATTFGSADLEAEVARLKAKGVVFTVEPTRQDWGSFAIFDDTCGNLISLHETAH